MIKRIFFFAVLCLFCINALAGYSSGSGRSGFSSSSRGYSSYSSSRSYSAPSRSYSSYSAPSRSYSSSSYSRSSYSPTHTTVVHNHGGGYGGGGGFWSGLMMGSLMNNNHPVVVQQPVPVVTGQGAGNVPMVADSVVQDTAYASSSSAGENFVLFILAVCIIGVVLFFCLR